MIWLGRESVAISMPFVTLPIGTPCGTAGPRRSHSPRTNWAGIAEIMSSEFWKAAATLLVGTMRSERRTPGR